MLIIATYDYNGKPNAMTAAWGSIGDTNELYLCISREHKTGDNLMLNKEFTVSIGEERLVEICDYLGLVSMKDNEDKLEKLNLHITKSEFVNAPIIEEFRFTLECRLKSYNEETGALTASIINISVDESILGKDGRVDYKLLSPITFDPVRLNYVKLGDVVGKSFKIGAKYIK